MTAEQTHLSIFNNGLNLDLKLETIGMDNCKIISKTDQSLELYYLSISKCWIDIIFPISVLKISHYSH